MRVMRLWLSSASVKILKIENALRKQRNVVNLNDSEHEDITLRAFETSHFLIEKN